MKIKISLLFFFLVFAFILSAHHPVKAEVQFDVEKAITAGDHKALAKYYRSQAEAQRKSTETHDKIRVAYQNNPIYYNQKRAPIMVAHCEELRVQALKMAELYDNLAVQEERQEAIK